ncbi:MAG: hypothetical protein Q8P07_00385 [bacterium]|nr:hypothetical protein [bacterium]
MIKTIYRAISYVLFSAVIMSVFVLADAYLNKGPNLKNIPLKLSWLAEEVGIREIIIPPPETVRLITQDEIEREYVKSFGISDPAQMSKVLDTIKFDRIYFNAPICGLYLGNKKMRTAYLSMQCGRDDEALVHELTHHVFYVIFGATNKINNEESLAREISRNYFIQKRWSLKFLNKAGLLGLITGRYS